MKLQHLSIDRSAVCQSIIREKGHTIANDRLHGGGPRQQLVSSLAADTAQPSALILGVPSAGDRPLKAKRLPPTSERNKDRLQSISYGEEGSGGEIEKPDCATGRQATLK